MRSWIVLGCLAAGACAPAIGDPCQTALDCSITGNRVCDTAPPGGTCTVFGCERDTCPAEATCVRWRPMESRLSFTACMRRCDVDGHCRVDEGYRCVGPEDVVDEATGEVLAQSVDAAGTRFCVATQPPEG